MQQKPVLNSWWSLKQGSIGHAHAKSTLLLLEFEGKAFSEQSQCTCSCWYLTSLLFKVYKKVVPSLHKPTTRYMFTLRWSHTQVHLHVNGSVRAKSGGRWSRSAGSRSPQRLLCTKWSVHGISVIKGRWPLTTEIVKSSFYCILFTGWTEEAEEVELWSLLLTVYFSTCASGNFQWSSCNAFVYLSWHLYMLCLCTSF